MSFLAYLSIPCKACRPGHVLWSIKTKSQSQENEHRNPYFLFLCIRHENEEKLSNTSCWLVQARPKRSNKPEMSKEFRRRNFPDPRAEQNFKLSLFNRGWNSGRLETILSKYFLKRHSTKYSLMQQIFYWQTLIAYHYLFCFDVSRTFFLFNCLRTIILHY